jgi:hypothetical protein
MDFPPQVFLPHLVVARRISIQYRSVFFFFPTCTRALRKKRRTACFPVNCICGSSLVPLRCHDDRFNDALVEIPGPCVCREYIGFAFYCMFCKNVFEVILVKFRREHPFVNDSEKTK